MGKVKDWFVKQQEAGVKNPDLSDYPRNIKHYAGITTTTGSTLTMAAMSSTYENLSGAFESEGVSPRITSTKTTKVAWKVRPCEDADDMGISDMIGVITWEVNPKNLTAEVAYIVLVDKDTKGEDPSTYLGSLIADVLKLKGERFRIVHEIKELK